MLKSLFRRVRPAEPEIRDEASFRALVDQAHAYYIGHFRAFVTEERKLSPRNGTELKYSVMENRRGLFAGKAVLDFMHIEPKKRPVECAPMDSAGLVPFTSTYRDMAVLVTALRWDGLTIASNVAAFDPARLHPWFESWFDPEDRQADPAAEFSGRIHKLVLFPKSLYIDLGTAPPAALWEMLDLLIAAGATKVSIGGEAR